MLTPALPSLLSNRLRGFCHLECKLQILIETVSQALLHVLPQQMKGVSAEAQGLEAGLHRLQMGFKKWDGKCGLPAASHLYGLAARWVDQTRLLHSLGRGFNSSIFCQPLKKSPGTGCLCFLNFGSGWQRNLNAFWVKTA